MSSQGYAGQTRMSSAPISNADSRSEDSYNLHFNSCPNALLDDLASRYDVIDSLNELDAEDNNPTLILTTVAKLLSTLSKAVHEYICAENPGRLRDGLDKPILFVLYESADHADAVWKGLGPPQVVGMQQFSTLSEYCVTGEDNVRYINVPLHRLETLVEAKALCGPENRPQAESYSSVFLEACPDRIGLYGLSVHWHGWSMHYADSTGMLISPMYRWEASQLGRLATYLHSVYIPPRRHYARDPTISWDISRGERQALQMIKVDDENFPIARTLFPGYIGRKRTTIYIAGRGTRGYQAIIKDCYLGLLEGYEEPRILKHIHSQGFVPGVVRLARKELVEFFDGERAAYIETVRPEYNACAKHRMILADMGESWLLAKSVNDLLMAVYDVLEVHRTLAVHAKILHRDISIGNVLMYPKYAPCANHMVMEDAPLLIDDVLADEPRLPEQRIARCLLIDFDLALSIAENRDPGSLRRALRTRVGTPSFVSRAAAVGRVLYTKHYPLPMPLLSDEAKRMYVHAYGQERYDKYCDGIGMCHGGVPAEPAGISRSVGTTQSSIPYQHRWEYDVESVYWTLYSVLLRVLPRGFSETPETDSALQQYWEILIWHQFFRSDRHVNLPQDTRSALLDCDLEAFLKPFPPIMQDVACLLYDMAQHVRIPYASMAELPEHNDHLHEAVQRLILEYLVRHKDDPIFLTPGELRIGDAPSAVAEYFDSESDSESDVVIVNTTDPEEGLEDSSEPEAAETSDVDDSDPALLKGSWSYLYFGAQYTIGEEEV
ncbi:hypothetical protein GY45DRAFT_1392082 [Cubamyces sp. BRFM 1775]|nr:hypothetical protein GY45DRAFT_1392082 [Cubamyces sp. BRFM 1775]